MGWKKLYWKTNKKILQHTEAKYYHVPINKLSEGTSLSNDYTWLKHLSGKGFITVDDLSEIRDYCKEYFPDIHDWDNEFETAKSMLLTSR